ncbi:hypothetical protein Vadar_005333 [Vaccinium darrowii]|uniref:Uncharacterized protein n=1 Tax=Vaccinium darrowii TaxID=229202 RepID=A0ACB7Z2Q5_9ERIC|nr:hypothetical protein Vadar_005333 [Vaccinium darrowii]
MGQVSVEPLTLDRNREHGNKVAPSLIPGGFGAEGGLLGRGHVSQVQHPAGVEASRTGPLIQSFEEDILHPYPLPEDLPMNLPEYGESQVDFGYLLEALNDKFGLPLIAKQRITEIGQTDFGYHGDRFDK